MKLWEKMIVASFSFGTLCFGFVSTVNAETMDTSNSNNLEVGNGQGLPDEFVGAADINDVLETIESFYNPIVPSPGQRIKRAAAGTKWQEGTVVWDGKAGNIVTSYFWVKGSNMSSWNKVGSAQRRAVIAKYGRVNANTSYKMKTQQLIGLSGQTQGQVTVWAKAWVYAKD